MTVNELRNDVAEILSYGRQIRFKYYNTIDLDGYDDDVEYTQTGSAVWCSGLVQPIDKKPFGTDGVLLQQGKIKVDDKKVYVLGNIQTSGLAPVKIGLGSPVTEEYEIINQGENIQWDAYGEPIYKKIYIRYLNTGSFIGEI